MKGRGLLEDLGVDDSIVWWMLNTVGRCGLNKFGRGCGFETGCNEHGNFRLAVFWIAATEVQHCSRDPRSRKNLKS